ncbi:hypothetical protein N7532_001318 [Penicillium argentinense]|uniref:Interferon-related developmental regulator N-terminal domain-containing protein n=1 Tax=Penicillium argentinense TaxID=1131581 RepID=A0A9W9G2D0_9EURO|nr:uncharacterized protein N7532_001318 [Penicillium argentinense]KAJ5110783.1 hypothetical protein N7532_001318 [Penicillium argentinense]
MPDLRRQIFESGKTVSRKAASREGSRKTSRAGSKQTSRQSSRATSRHPSDDDEAGYASDDTAMSIGSLDDENPEQDNEDWPQELGDRIQELIDRKRSSVQGREEALAAFCRLTKYHYALEEIGSHVQDLLSTFARSVRSETSIREATSALRAIELLAITSSDDKIYLNTEQLLTRAIRDSSSPVVKAAAINCLGACTLFGGAGEESILDQMTFLLDIVASDGQSIDASDDVTAVSAALQIWGLLATEIEDYENDSEEAAQIFIDQLDSGDSGVQIAAGECIALLYEKSYTPQEDDEDDEISEGDEDDEHGLIDPTGPKLIKRYNAYHNTPELERQLHSLATVHSKRISKRDKKSLHSNFTSILTTVENPRRGPRYNMAIDQDTNRHYGSTLTVKIGRHGIMSIDRWWKWVRLTSLRRILQGGFAEHYYQGNRAVLESLPVMMRSVNDSRSGNGDRQSARKAAKMRNSRHWTAHASDDDE